MDSNIVNNIQKEVSEAIKSILEKHNLELIKNNCRYDDDSLNLSLRLIVKNNVVIEITERELNFGCARTGTKCYFNKQ
jgi:hypothetical protein